MPENMPENISGKKNINGFFLIDKESGINSFKLVMALRRILGMKRVGFAGTLDPLASGLMVLACGEYTKLLPYLESADKVYEVLVRMDGTSDTYDADGQISELDPKSYTSPSYEVVNKTIEQNFVGKLQQIPPRFSAISIDGQRAYDMARAGKEFEMKPREVTIFSIELLEYAFPLLRLRVHCSSGTYIRSLAYDIGRALGVGGYVVELRRVAIGKIPVEKAVLLPALESGTWSEHLAPVEGLLSGMGKCELTEEQYRVLALGNFVEAKSAKCKAQSVEEGAGSVGADECVLAYYRGVVVGVLETCEGGRMMKFKKKLNIVL